MASWGLKIEIRSREQKRKGGKEKGGKLHKKFGKRP